MKSKNIGSILSGFLLGLVASLIVVLIVAWAINRTPPLSEKDKEIAEEHTIPEAQLMQAMPAAPAAAPAAASGEASVGESVYHQTCSACHAAGIIGAPMYGNHEAWAPRIAQGMDTLYNHALHGLTTASGAMPPKGGNASLSDSEVKAAVDFMVDGSK